MTAEQPVAYALSVEQSKLLCHNCKKLGHWAKECPEPNTRKKSGSNESSGIVSSNANGVTPTKVKSNVGKKENKGNKTSIYSTHVSHTDAMTDVENNFYDDEVFYGYPLCDNKYYLDSDEDDDVKDVGTD